MPHSTCRGFSVMRRTAWILLIITLVGLASWHLQRHSDPSPAPPASEAANLDKPAPVNAANAVDKADVTSPVVTNGTKDLIRFETRLLPDGPIGAATDSVRLGLAYVSPDEARTWQAWKEGGSVGAGPASYAELATVERWLDLPAERLPDGSVRVGPITLPPADRFELQARSASPLHFYLATFTADAYPVDVHPTVAAGLRIVHQPAPDADVRVLLRRTRDIDAGAPWQSLLAREAPQLLGAYDDAAVAVVPNAVLAPLPPGPLEVILEIDGIEAERLPVDLRAGAITDLQFDPVKQQVAQAVSVQLQLDFVIEGTRRPIPDIKVTWYGGKSDQCRNTDARGGVRFQGVDRQKPQRFNLEMPTGEEALPNWPAQRAIEFTPDTDAEPVSEQDTRQLRKTIELRPLQWLMVRTGNLAIPETPVRNNPYPIFVLQRDQSGSWADVAADHFIRIDDGIAASLQDAGRHRLVALQAPWALLYSTPSQTRSASGRYPVSLIPDPGRPVAITVRSQGIPLAHAPVTLRGPVHSLPASAIDTDSQGQIRLNGVTETRLELEVPGYEVMDVDLRSTSVVVELTPGDDPH